jgi:hypothetical protein
MEEANYMLTSVRGVCRDGRVELLEPAPQGVQGPVIVTFLETGTVDLSERGIDPSQAADLRSRLAAIADDWDRPEMSAYDAP